MGQEHHCTAPFVRLVVIAQRRYVENGSHANLFLLLYLSNEERDPPRYDLTNRFYRLDYDHLAASCQLD